MTAKKRIAVLAALTILLIGAAGGLWYHAHEADRVIVHQGPDTITTAVPDEPRMTFHGPIRWQPEKQGRYVASGAIDRRGRIWIGSEDEGLWRFDGGEWKHITPADGIGENSVYAIACDSLGRIWAGQNRRGVAVYNGEKWKIYDPANGPLGSHVSAIKVCPATAPHGAGDVWMVTELGLVRYSISTNSWSYFTRVEGLPCDQASCLDFDSQGNLYVGLRCDGLAMAQASDDYKTWRTVRGPEEPPPGATGAGLPCNTINAVLVADTGDVFVATNHGLARSTDHGKQWTFFRGKDWVAKLQDSIDGVPADWKPPTDPAPMAEDHIVALAQDESGSIWIGYQTKGYQCLDESTLKVLASNQSKTADWCAMILPIPGAPPLLGTRGFGLSQVSVPSPTSGPTKALQIAAGRAELPVAAEAPSAAELNELTARVKAMPDGAKVAAVLGEDWQTQGDWVGHYGRQNAKLAVNWWINANSDYQIINDYPTTGPHGGFGSCVGFTLFANAKSGRCLYFPALGHRMQSEWNDNGGRDMPNFEGPDLWVGVAVPAGVHRVSLFIHDVGHNSGSDRRRDYTIQVKPYVDSVEAAQHQPTLVDERVMPSENPAYRTFLLSQGSYWIRLASDYSQMVSLQGVFFDLPNFTAPQENDSVASILYGIPYAPPQPGPENASESPQLHAARALWSALDAKYGAAPAMQLPYRIRAYRAAIAGGADANLLTNWRWNLHLWTPEDRAEFEKVMAQARKLIPPPATRQSVE